MQARQEKLRQIWLPLTHLVVLVLVQLNKVVKQHQDILNAWATAFCHTQVVQLCQQ